jgi:hypothetical protein
MVRGLLSNVAAIGTLSGCISRLVLVWGSSLVLPYFC